MVFNKIQDIPKKPAFQGRADAIFLLTRLTELPAPVDRLLSRSRGELGDTTTDLRFLGNELDLRFEEDCSCLPSGSEFRDCASFFPYAKKI